MTKYDLVLFDADETLFHFDSFAGLQLMFERFSVQFTRAHFDEYQKQNKALFADYQNGLIDANHVKTKRFETWSHKLLLPEEHLNSAFLGAMADLCQVIHGAEQLLAHLHGRAKLGIITNGFVELQHVRLERTNLKRFFDFVVISEEVGVAKPDPAIFDHALNLAGDPKKHRVLMVGDTLESDILGGIRSGLDTCWFNPSMKVGSPAIVPTYEIRNFSELFEKIG